MRSSLELCRKVRLHLPLAHSILGILGGLDGSCLLVSLLHSSVGQFRVLMRKGGQVWLVQDCLLHTIWSGDASSTDGP